MSLPLSDLKEELGGIFFIFDICGGAIILGSFFFCAFNKANNE
jgi:hypothetical protein